MPDDGTVSSTLSNRSSYQAPIVRPISQAAFHILGKHAFDRAVEEVAVWMRSRNREIPESALRGDPFRVGGGAVYPAEAVFIESGGPRLWAATLEDTREQQNYGRTWVTEVTVGEHDGKAAFGARLSLVMRSLITTFHPSRPGCVRQVLSQLIASSDGFRLTELPIEIDSDQEIADLLALISSKQRRLPIVALSSDARGEFGVDADKLAQKISGLAHIMKLSPNASWEITHQLGKANSTFLGATRLYRPNFDAIDGNPFDHPLWLNRDDSVAGRSARLSQIVAQITFASLSTFSGDDNFPRYEEVRRVAAETAFIRAKEVGAEDADLLALYELENERLSSAVSSQKSEHDDAIQLASDELMRAEGIRDEALAERAVLRMRVASLEAAIRERGQIVQSEPLESFGQIEEWAQRNLTGSIWIARKAIRETEKNGQFEDVQLFGRTLLMLRDAFVPMKRNPGNEQHVYYQKCLRDLNFTDELCFSQRGAIRGYPEYRVTYSGDEYWCENHIKYGGGTDPRKFFRIYYYWHEADSILLIGHMPSHLDNKLTN